MIKIDNHRIVTDDGAVPYLASRNKGGKIKATAIVVHDTASPLTPGGDIAWLRGGPGQSQNASAHVVIDRFGKITQLIDLNVKGWHAGASKWNGKANCNDFTIGFEIDNPGGPLRKVGEVYKGIATFDPRSPAAYGPPELDIGHAKTPQHGDGYWLAYTDEQIATVVDLCRACVAAYPSIKEIITHWMIAPGRKIDTNPLFPLQAVRDRVFGGGKVPAKAPPMPDSSKPDKVAPPKIILDATVLVNDLNMRREPSMSGEVMGKLQSGQRIDVQEAHGDWLLIKTPMGFMGYVFAKMVKLDD